MGLLRKIGYAKARHYHGGIADWKEAGGAVETALSGAPSRRSAAPEPLRSESRSVLARPDASRRRRANTIVDGLERLQTRHLFLLWLAMVLLLGVAYWIAAAAGSGLSAGGVPVALDAHGLGTAIYFSFVTATSLGYGDVVPLGFVRVLAVVEAVAGLLTFGAVVSKFVSRRQDEIVREIHRVTFEERLDRVQSNLHLVLSELQAIAALCADAQVEHERLRVRLESAAMVFAAEMRAVHDLLYRPQQTPDEGVLEAILATLAAALQQLTDLLSCLPAEMRGSSILDRACRRLARLAMEICGECVPRAYAPALTVWIDRIQETARGIGGIGG